MAGLVRHVQQHAESTRAIPSVEFGSQRIREAMAHAAIVGCAPIAKEPRIVRAGRVLRGERDFLARRDHSWIDAESRRQSGRGRKRRLRRSA